MELKLYDTLTREKRVFSPLDPNNVRMYVCGPTVYDFAHIGNARPVIVFDVLFRLLRHLYGADHVTYVRNITDVDDKIILRAAEEYPGLPLNEAIREVTEKTDKQFHEDAAALGCLPPTFEPRATDHIAEMRTLIERLLASGNAYVADDNVLFSVPSMKDYGQLSKKPPGELIAGARVEVAPYKRDPRDFVLWKPSKPGEPAWPSPAGIKAPGRPGWHIECSAMSWKYLGETFDIHGGGIDLVFPHHEDEIAQSRCAFHTPLMANFWMHNGFLQVEGDKMAKSEGNFVTIRDLYQTTVFGGRKWPTEVLRLATLRTHYRQPIDWTVKALEDAEKNLEKWLRILHEVLGRDALVSDSWPNASPLQQFMFEIGDDLNTPSIIAGLSVVANSLSDPSYRLNHHAKDEAWEFIASLELLGLVSQLRIGDLLDYALGLSVKLGSDQVATIEALVDRRTAARGAKNFKESDRIRDELAKMGVVLKDTKDGTTWEIAR